MRPIEPSPHTQLINHVIGFCKKSDTWAHPLEELGYDVKLIEQPIKLSRTAMSQSVKPDVVVLSNGHRNIIAFDCKSGKNADTEQAERYKKLTNDDLLRWIDFFDENSLTHDVCYFHFKENYERLAPHLSGFPLLVMSADNLSKAGTAFSRLEVEKKFRTEIDLKDKLPPTSFYPFSTDDNRGIIIPHVMRGIVSVLLDKEYKGIKIFDEKNYEDSRLMRKIHKMYDLLSTDDRRVLFEKVHGTLDHLRIEKPKFHQAILDIQNSSKDPQNAFSKLIAVCEEIAQEEEGKGRLDML